MTPSPPRNYRLLGAAIVIAGVVIGAGIFASSYFATSTIRTQTTATTAATSGSCHPTTDVVPAFHFAFAMTVNYTGPWNATVTGYSGATSTFVDCYTGRGVGLIYLSDWNLGGQATLYVVAQKTDAGSGNLTISMKYGSSNSITQSNSTSLPYGTATIAATMLEAAAISPSSIVTTTVSEAQLYDVTFQQLGDCSPPQYIAPWSVTLGSQTIAEPSNATLPITGGSSTMSPGNQGLSTIVFSVPNGVYQYSISPSGTFTSSHSGSVTVDGFGVLVMVYGPAIGCTTTTVPGPSP